ncbi:MAG: RecQ family ATP-dependent DNA helicase [Prevotella sp.]|nr:RecQ family ATP-dependent DNA helicase [Prevotella sp.]
MPKNDKYSDILKRHWGYDDFRGIQRDIIESIGAGRDTLGLMPTGGGKSITFQVPALAQEGVCIVVTPLIALMKDQVGALRRRRIKAAAIYSGMSHDDIVQTLENAVFGAVKLLYVSPERLGSELFQKKLGHMKVCFICVDEAHCISQWGYDFRPSYLQISAIRRLLPGVPVLALTATATPAVVTDIQEKLSVKENNFRLFRMSFERKNLTYVVRHAADKREQLLHILRSVAGPAIIYARSRQRTKEVAEMLTAEGFSATYFHAGLDNAEKDIRQKGWQADQTRIIVATNAFGMGIDKPDVRLVIHIDCPDSIEAYFQEAGRAGRDGQRSYAVLLFNGSDEQKLWKRIDDNFPEKDYIRQVYDHLAYFYQIGVGSGYNAVFEFPIDKFCRNFRHFPIRVESALKILHRAGYIEYMEEEESQARLRFSLERDDLYRLKGNSPVEDKMIVALLRNYSGLFSDFGYIDEAFLAQQTDLKVHEVYLTLKSLAQKRIVQFIPQKKTPYIRYMQRREDSEHLLFPPAVYDDLKQRFAERIEAMLDYATDGQHCRSRQLLRYFGEVSAHDCGHCDVCLQHNGGDNAKDAIAEAKEKITQLLADGRQHHLDELHQMILPYESIEAALRWLVDEEAIIYDEGFISLPSNR